jgi:hypothetical protein
LKKCSTHYPMAAMSEKKYEEKYSWEGIKAGLEFSDMNGSPIDVEGLKFRFIYRDQYGRTCEVSQEGDKRVNCVLRDGELIAVFEPNTFRKGILTVERHYCRTDSDFASGYWEYGGEDETNIKIV